MPYEVQQTRWDRIIRRVSGSIGPGSRVSETLSELFPMIDVEQVPGELLLLGGTRIGFGGVVVTPSPLAFGRMQLFNPADSGVLATITTVILSTTADSPLRWTLDSAAREDQASSERHRDGRVVVTAETTCRVFSESTVTQLPAIGNARVLADTPFILEDTNGVAVLSPGSGFSIGANTVNVGVTGTFYWRERTAENSELSL